MLSFGVSVIKPAQKTYESKKLEVELQNRWQTDRIYEKIKELHAGDPTWFFLDGPPYASGTVHLGTA